MPAKHFTNVGTGATKEWTKLCNATKKSLNIWYSVSESKIVFKLFENDCIQFLFTFFSAPTFLEIPFISSQSAFTCEVKRPFIGKVWVIWGQRLALRHLLSAATSSKLNMYLIPFPVSFRFPWLICSPFSRPVICSSVTVLFKLETQGYVVSQNISCKLRGSHLV